MSDSSHVMLCCPLLNVVMDLVCFAKLLLVKALVKALSLPRQSGAKRERERERERERDEKEICERGQILEGDVEDGIFKVYFYSLFF